MASQSQYINDFTRYFFKKGILESAPSVSGVPEEVENFVSIAEAISTLQMYGCWGKSIQSAKEEMHCLCLDVLRLAVEKYGEVIPIVYRGCNGSLPLSDHKILYGSTNKKVAQFYGEVSEFKAVKGLRTYSTKESVISCKAMDEEIIFFPEALEKNA